jgi:nuclear pore complex protein Nup98-Nup96
VHSVNRSSSSPKQIRCLETWEVLVRIRAVVSVSVFVSCLVFVNLITLLTGAFSGNNNASGSVFGAPKPATGFGAFGGGGTSAFGTGGTGAFGGTTTAPSAFGQPSASTSTNTGGVFGGASGGNNIFGQKPANSVFGATASTFFPHLRILTSLTISSANTPATNPVTTGSSNPPYAVHNEKDPSSTNLTLQYQSISCMPAYQGTSFEVSF